MSNTGTSICVSNVIINAFYRSRDVNNRPNVVVSEGTGEKETSNTFNIAFETIQTNIDI